jgi:hypothetical protein
LWAFHEAQPLGSLSTLLSTSRVICPNPLDYESFPQLLKSLSGTRKIEPPHKFLSDKIHGRTWWHARKARGNLLKNSWLRHCPKRNDGPLDFRSVCTGEKLHLLLNVNQPDNEGLHEIQPDKIDGDKEDQQRIPDDEKTEGSK